MDNVQDHRTGGTPPDTTPLYALPMIKSLKSEIERVREHWGKEKHDHRQTRFWRKFYVRVLAVVSVLAVPGWLFISAIVFHPSGGFAYIWEVLVSMWPWYVSWI